jgi:PAS domain S-box-containing protein
MTLLVIRDISDRRRAENALRESEQQLRLITDTAPVYLARIDLEHRYLFVNKSYALRFGLDPDSLIGKRAPEVVGEQAYLAFRPYVERALAGETVEFDMSVPYKGIRGTQYVHATYVPERDGKGQIQGLIAAITDISARKLAEDQLRQADKRKDEFLAMLGHELRNPLGPIRTSVQIMSRVPSDSPKMKEARAMIARQVEHLTRMVDDLLDVSRVTEGKIALRLETLELGAVIQQAIDTAKPLIDAHRHTLTVSMEERPLYVRADSVRLAQVFANLLQNASKFTPDGGCIELCVEVEQKICRIVVRDNGIGITEELLPYVFDLFTQAERAADRAQGGLGIGLTVVRKLVELHGGRISASSRGADQGSEFTVELPLVPTQTHEMFKKEDKHIPSVSSQRKILVVDDNVDSANSMALILKLDGHETRVAYDGEEALDLATAFKPELVLLDIGLPGLDGYRVAQRFRAMPQTPRAILIAITGYGQPEDQRRAKEAGFDHFLVKPVDLAALAALINADETVVES